MIDSNDERRAASPVRDAMTRHEVLAAGLISGAAAAVAMMLVAMCAAAVQDLPAVLPLRVIGESFVGAVALGGTAPKVAFGVVVQVATSAALGVLFTAVVPREHPLGCSMALGAGFALLAMGALVSTVVPWVNPGFLPALQPLGGAMVVAHAAFGVTLGIAPPLRRWIARTSGAASPAGETGPSRAAPAAPTTRTT